MSDRDMILDKAKVLINTDRANEYGDTLPMHQSIADGWNVIVRKAETTHGFITPSHVALMMDWLKTCRLLNKLDHEDSWADKCGYTALGGEMSKQEP